MATPTANKPQPTEPRRPMRNNAQMLRFISRVLVGALVIVVIIVFVIHSLVDNGQRGGASLQGTSLGGSMAPNFTLTDQNGESVSLAGLRGHPVVLTFFYTHSTDDCPVTASKFQTVLKELGSQLSDVRWIAVSIDPVGDTPQNATAFVAQHGLTGSLHYLLGTQNQLVPIWTAYSVAVEAGTAAPGSAGAGAIQHTGGVWLIDAQGRERVYLNVAFDPKTLASDLKILTAK